jgi:CubicO group peptidase (beta-lactamase class C family)
MRMVESGELNLDRPLSGYVPPDYLEKRYVEHPLTLEGFRAGWFRRITARMVLSHSSGLPHGDPRTPLPVFFEPGTQYRYSADGYLYLQRVMEFLKGKPLEAIMKETVIDPLGMSASSLVWQERYEKEAAVGHDVLGETEGKFRKRTEAHAGATLYTTARDYARFVIAMMNDIGLKPETVREMLEPQIDVAKDVFWGLGFGLEKTPNGDAFWQWELRHLPELCCRPQRAEDRPGLSDQHCRAGIGQDLVRAAIGEEPAYTHRLPSTLLGPRSIKVRGEVSALPEFRQAHPEEFDGRRSTGRYR